MTLDGLESSMLPDESPPPASRVVPGPHPHERRAETPPAKPGPDEGARPRRREGEPHGDPPRHDSPETKPPANESPDRDPHQQRPRRTRTRTIGFIVIALAIVLLVFLVWGIVERVHRDHELAAAVHQTQAAPPRVAVIHAARPQESSLSLAANTQAIADAVIYARTSGYIVKRYVDLGDSVKAGQLLAEVESPEIDQQLHQAQADLRQSQRNLELQKANLEFARVTVERYKAADREGAVAKEDLDQRISNFQTAQAAVAAAEANVGSNEANVSRYEQLTSFERVVAPFDGTVVQRNVDVGSLITAGSPTNNISLAPTTVNGAANGLFEIAQLHTLRVFVNVPQAYAGNVKPGIGAKVAVRGQLTTPILAKVTRTAESLDPSTRTLLAEVDIPNEQRRLMPGMFVYVGFNVSTTGSRWRVPDTAVIFNERGTQVYIVEAGNKLHIQPVVLGRDFGSEIDIQAGIDGSCLLVKQPTVSLEEGQIVEPLETHDQPPG